MAMLNINVAPLTPSEHQIQLRRAVIASTSEPRSNGTTSFFISTVTGRRLRQAVFLTLILGRELEAFAIYAVGFVARAHRSRDFGHYGDRIGRNSTLIATLLLMAWRPSPSRWCRRMRASGIWGAVILTALRFIQGAGRRRRMGGSV